MVVQGCEGPSRALEGLDIQEKKKRQIVMAVCSSIHRQEGEQINKTNTGWKFGAFASVLCPGLFRGRRGLKSISQWIFDMGFQARLLELCSRVSLGSPFNLREFKV